jgi:FAD/FMN-containing dehydrogenase
MANDAVVIDLKNMTAVRVDPEKKLAYIQAGADGGTSIMRSPSTT